MRPFLFFLFFVFLLLPQGNDRLPGYCFFFFSVRSWPPVSRFKHIRSRLNSRRALLGNNILQPGAMLCCGRVQGEQGCPRKKISWQALWQPQGGTHRTHKPALFFAAWAALQSDCSLGIRVCGASGPLVLNELGRGAWVRVALSSLGSRAASFVRRPLWFPVHTDCLLLGRHLLRGSDSLHGRPLSAGPKSNRWPRLFVCCCCWNSRSLVGAPLAGACPAADHFAPAVALMRMAVLLQGRCARRFGLLASIASLPVNQRQL